MGQRFSTAEQAFEALERAANRGDEGHDVGRITVSDAGVIRLNGERLTYTDSSRGVVEVTSLVKTFDDPAKLLSSSYQGVSAVTDVANIVRDTVFYKRTGEFEHAYDAESDASAGGDA